MTVIDVQMRGQQPGNKAGDGAGELSDGLKELHLNNSKTGLRYKYIKAIYIFIESLASKFKSFGTPRFLP